MGKVCHYELLGVELDADEKVLKRAYRKLSKKWHPDRNFGNEKEATKKFKQIVEAYEVLTDPNERAWYDAHREQILLGVDPNSNESGDNLNLWQYFTSSCYDDFTDLEDGYFGVYLKVFNDISRVEKISGDPETEAPPFGKCDSDYKIPKAFYSFWKNFRSSRTFAFADKYKPSDAPNRWVRRKINEENKKLRNAKKKEYNETVRRLVAFVKKRDPRILEHLAKVTAENAERERKNREEKKRQEKEQRERAQKAREEEKLKLEELYRTNPEEFEEEFIEEFECVACGKVYKSEKQIKHHEESKKHKKNVKKLRRALEREERLFERKKKKNSQEQVSAEVKDEFAIHKESKPDLFEDSEEDLELLRLEAELAALNRKKSKKNRKKKNDKKTKSEPEGISKPAEIPEQVTKKQKRKNRGNESETKPRKETKKQKRRRLMREEAQEKKERTCSECNKLFGSRNELSEHLPCQEALEDDNNQKFIIVDETI